MLSALPDEMVQRISAGIPLGRVGEAEDIANAYLYLASDLASYVTGVTLRVDDPEAIKQMVSGGVGVAVLSALAVEQEVQNGTLLAFEMDKSALKRTIYLITLKSQQLSRMEQKLVDFLKSPHRRKRAEAQN